MTDAPATPLRSPQETAELSARAMWNDDRASQRLGMHLDRIAPGAATLTMTVTETMSNGHGNCHGGYIFTLADSAFAFAYNSHGDVAVAQTCTVTYLAPGRIGDRLTAAAREVWRRGRSGLYDISVTREDGTQVAEFRGLSRTVRGSHLPGSPA